MKIEIKHRFTEAVLFSLETESLRLCLEAAIKSGADLRSAYLRSAHLEGAYLQGADLQDADLEGAYLQGADLQGADLQGAHLQGAIGLTAQPYQTVILPEGDLIVWKKCRDKVLVKCQIGKDVKRSNATGRKCRAESIEVLEVIGAEVGLSMKDGKTEYRKGKTVKCDKWDENWAEECSGGIHFFITRQEAEEFEL